MINDLRIYYCCCNTGLIVFFREMCCACFLISYPIIYNQVQSYYYLISIQSRLKSLMVALHGISNPPAPLTERPPPPPERMPYCSHRVFFMDYFFYASLEFFVFWTVLLFQRTVDHLTEHCVRPLKPNRWQGIEYFNSKDHTSASKSFICKTFFEGLLKKYSKNFNKKL